ncbi:MULTISPECIES: hypothetical protein [Weeksella]|uniref:hypothetical protein n=1 Tax=Weeksella TaxID=1013 RepID=UPI0008A3C40E|nr:MULTISPECIES: hypothetical protein [Weeksella]MDK7374688.1 DUF2892 domain-containing protein [Weeksella virosa]MDK7674836.1 DUF2892 domain-containing protein [Weeksella virosa]OFM83222.1 hypothetical protein HMPREF2660_01545 [Weeksella sp. HMSC059D05]SUP54522.1 Uncharacterised protein [Weeksella virosa]
MNKYLKLVLAGVLIISGIYLFTDRAYGWGFIMLFLAIFPIVFYFRNENIIMAFWFMRKQEVEKAKKWLNRITNQETQLIRKQWGYFNYMKGITEAEDNIAVSEKYMRNALDYGLSFKHDRAMANLSLAGAAMAKGRRKEAEIYLKEAKRLDDKNMFTDHIKMMQGQMKKFNFNPGQLQNPNMRHRGKKF